MHYNYCPICGTKLKDKKAGDDGAVPYCYSCSKYWFDGFSSAAIVLVANEYGEMAMLRQGYISHEYWTYVAGYMKPGESAEETAVREVYEELGLKIERLEYGGTHWFPMGDQLMHGFIGFTKKKDFTLSSEVDEAVWVPASDAPKLMFPEVPGNTQYPLYRQYMKMTQKT
ncbi:MAG: NUDIX domain-containing protein [Clostridia bacterium]|nr:NUDIX domain-containing protein [Clostridia bacterium]